jgi:hypothetical protein
MARLPSRGCRGDGYKGRIFFQPSIFGLSIRVARSLKWPMPSGVTMMRPTERAKAPHVAEELLLLEHPLRIRARVLASLLRRTHTEDFADFRRLIAARLSKAEEGQRRRERPS